jgi:hypothetical protein
MGLIGPGDAWAGVAKCFDVHLSLIGMMLLSELARQERPFEWLASIATAYAKGSPKRLFVLIYAVGIVVTAFLSNAAIRQTDQTEETKRWTGAESFETVLQTWLIKGSFRELNRPKSFKPRWKKSSVCGLPINVIPTLQTTFRQSC